MDEHRFDGIARALGAPGSRRGALRLLVGGAAALLAGGPLAGTIAKPKKRKKKKAACPKKSCPPGRKRNKRTCKCECERTACTGGMEFDSKACRCACPRDMRECRDGCVPRNGCCPSDPLCPEDSKGCCHSPGVDVCTIDGCCAELDGMKACNDFCIDTNTHPSHCGDCNVACDAGTPCIRGRCEPLTCPNGEPACGVQCCEDGEQCCNGECRFNGTAICTNDGWCPPVTGHACCGTAGCAEGPCCNVDIEACCVSLAGNGDIETHCCPGDGDECAPGGCCPIGTRWTSDGNCDACCPPGAIGCQGCIPVEGGRG